MICLKYKKASHQWMRLNQIIWNFKLIIFSLLFLNFILLILFIQSLNRNPVVVGLTDSENFYFIGKRQSVATNTNDVIQTSKKFLENRYQWKTYSVNEILGNTAPFVTPYFYEKLKDQLDDSKEFIEKNKISQDIIIRKTEVGKDFVRIDLDRVVTVQDKVKAVRPLQVYLEIVIRNPNTWNPRGLYINSIKESEGLKP